jgi:hypothetical protein
MADAVLWDDNPSAIDLLGFDGQLDVLDGSPRAAVEDELGLVEPDHRLGQGVVVGVPPGADRRRLHSSLDYLSPAEYERQIHHRKAAQAA